VVDELDATTDGNSVIDILQTGHCKTKWQEKPVSQSEHANEA